MRKVTREGRIVIWEGASLWAFDVVPVGRRRSTEFHAHHAYQITLSAGGIAHIHAQEELFTEQAILIGPDVRHALEPEGRIALLFVEPESRDGAALRTLLQGRTVIGMNLDSDIVRCLRGLWAHPRPQDAEITDIGRSVLRSIAGERADGPPLECRIERVLALIRSKAGEAVSLPEAAAVACLSESRFSHLFVEEVGLPLRTYLLWRRLMLAVSEFSNGRSLTEAAHNGGFSDSAHFSRTFRRMFGLPAASLGMIRRDQPFP